jgi:beta-lactam-binding protein with PASTA domain/endonuclease YncB( thermonuclease family)
MLFKKSLRLFIALLAIITFVSCEAGTTQTTTNTPTTETTETPTTEVTTNNLYTLPSLEGMHKQEIITALEGSGISYTFKWETNLEISEEDFIRYDGLEVGDQVELGSNVVIFIATPHYVLPDFSGKTQSEIFSSILGKGFSFSFEVEVNNDVPDQTFSKFGDELEAGDVFDGTTTLVIYIGFNTVTLPDLTNKLKSEIVKILTEAQIQYNFEYVVDDDYPEDMFISYKDMQIGDFYEDEPVTILLYQNTFTSNPTSLIISKYVDGGDGTNDQAIEIYNPTDSNVFLGDYHLAIFINGALEATNIIEFEDVDLAPGETYIIANKASTNGDLLRSADIYVFELNFDGNDTIQLRYKNNTYIDSIYHIGNRDFIFDNEIFVRKVDVVKGARDFSFTEWTAYVPSYIDLLGTHPFSYNPTNGVLFQFINREFDDPLGGMNAVTLYYINDGDTASFSPGFIDNERVRFLGVDTPETFPVTDPWGPEAKAYTTLILNAAIEIYIQSDPDLGYTETYGRHLGLVWVNLGVTGIVIDIENSSGVVMRTEHLSGWILLNYHLVLNGYSYNYYSSNSNLVFENRYLYRYFQDAQLFAQENGLGIHE